MQRFDELGNVGAHHFAVRAIVAADLFSDAGFVKPALHQFKNFGPDNVQAEHLPVMDVEQNSTVLCLCSPDGVGYSEHGANRLEETDGAVPSTEHC